MLGISRGPRGGWEVGKSWSLLLFPLLIPALLIGAAVSVPYSLVARRLLARRKRALEDAMKRAGRLMAWSDFIREMEHGRGTLIVQRSSFKGPVDCWWTADDTYKACPYPAVDWVTMLKEPAFQPLCQWYNEHYTSLTRGRAFLVAGPLQADSGTDLGRKLVTKGLEFGRWVEIPPLERLERRKIRATTE